MQKRFSFEKLQSTQHTPQAGVFNRYPADNQMEPLHAITAQLQKMKSQTN